MKSSKQKLAYQAEYQKRPENVEKRVDRNRVRRQALAAGIVKKGDGTEYTGAPSLESIDFGCRSGVIFSPCDLTCGWDGHEHPRGTRVAVDQARQVGANLLGVALNRLKSGRGGYSYYYYHYYYGEGKKQRRSGLARLVPRLPGRHKRQ